MSRPNIVLIVSDQHRADYMGCAGKTFLHTPNLDRLAREGVRFTEAYCNAPLCGPSRMSMLTGRQLHEIGIYSNEHILASETPTFVQALALAGYETVLCGRMHFMGPDQRHGYARRFVGDITRCYPGGPVTDYGELRRTAQETRKSLESIGPGDSPVLHYDEAVTRSCEDYLLNRKLDANAEQPLFLTVGFYGPHNPYIAPPEHYEQALRAMSDVRDEDLPIPRSPQPQHPWEADWFKRYPIDDLSDEQAFRVRVNYAGLVNLMDQLVGRVVEAVRSLPGETVVIYLSDHGDMMGDRGMFWKSAFFDGAVKVPVIFHQLNGQPETIVDKGRTCSFPVSLADLASTLVQLGSAPQLPAQSGSDLTPLLRGDLPPEERSWWEQRAIFSELAVPVPSQMPIRMLRKDKYKLIYYHQYESVQLFDLTADPCEQHDLRGMPEYSSVTEELLTLLMDGWNPADVRQALLDKAADREFVRQWGEQVGMGPSDLWEPSMIRLS